MELIKKYEIFLEDRQLGKSLADQTKNEYVFIYRACQIDVNNFYDMDYITLSKKFAIEHAENNHIVNEEPYHVIIAYVKTSNVYDAYNPGEYFYHGSPLKGREIYVSKGDEYEIE